MAPVVRRGPARQAQQPVQGPLDLAAVGAADPGAGQRHQRGALAGVAQQAELEVAGDDGVLEVVHGVGDVVRPVHDLRLEAAPAVRRTLHAATVKTSRSSSYTPNLRRRPSRRGHGYLLAASSAARVRLRPALRPSARENVLASSRVRIAGSARCPRTRRCRARPRRARASPVWPNGGWPRSWARQAVSTRSGSQPSALPSSRPIWAHSSEWVSRVRGKSLSAGTTTWVFAASRRNAAECSTRARSRSYAVRPGRFGGSCDPALVGGRRGAGSYRVGARGRSCRRRSCSRGRRRSRGRCSGSGCRAAARPAPAGSATSRRPCPGRWPSPGSAARATGR